MPTLAAHPAATRDEALRLLRETDLSVDAIAARVGAGARTIQS